MTDRSINILDLRDSPWVDGPGRTILDCAESLEGNGFHFIIAGFSGGAQKTNEYTNEARNRNLDVVIIEEKNAFDYNVIRQILSIISEYKIDVIHAHDFRSDLFGLLCAKIRRKPIVSTIHGWIANDKKGVVYTWLDKRLLRFFNKVISVSNKTAKIAVDSGINSNKITVINNALKLENYEKYKVEKCLRKELGLSTDAVLIANIGRLSPEKGQLDFLKASETLLKKHEQVKVLLIGIGENYDMLKKYAVSHNIDDSVFMLGFRKDMVNIYNNVNMIVQSSYTEGMPNVVLEAMLMRVPVIATNVGGTCEIIEHKKTGTVFNAGDILKLSELLEDFVEQSDCFYSMAIKGEAIIRNNFSHRKRVKKLADFYIDSINP